MVLLGIGDSNFASETFLTAIVINFTNLIINHGNDKNFTGNFSCFR